MAIYGGGWHIVWFKIVLEFHLGGSATKEATLFSSYHNTNNDAGLINVLTEIHFSKYWLLLNSN